MTYLIGRCKSMVALGKVVAIVLGSTSCRCPETPVSSQSVHTQEAIVQDIRVKPADVKSLLWWQNQPLEAVQKALGASGVQVRNNAIYEKLENVSELFYPAAFPGHFYFRDGLVALLYIGDEAYLSRLSPATIEGELGTEGVWHRSREGKTAGLYVFPQHGFAYSSDGETIGFVEVFPVMTLDEYRRSIYADPGPFFK